MKSEFDLSRPNIDTIDLPSKTKNSYQTNCCFATGWGRKGFGKYNIIVELKVNVGMIFYIDPNNMYKSILTFRWTILRSFKTSEASLNGS